MILGFLGLVSTPVLAKASSLVQTRKTLRDQVTEASAKLVKSVVKLEKSVKSVYEREKESKELSEHFAEQRRIQTEKMLQDWAKNKPHFERVRMAMGHLLEPDPKTGIPAIRLKNGRIDLDEAFSQACFKVGIKV